MINLEALKDKEQTLKYLSQFSKVALESFTVTELRVISKSIIANNSKYKKVELINLILESINTYNRANAYTIKVEIGDNPTIEDLASSLKNYYLNGKEPLELSDKLKKVYILKENENSNGYSLSTLKTKPEDIKKAISLVLSTIPNAKNFCNTFYKDIYFNHLKEFERLYNAEYNAKINAIKTVSDKKQLDGKKILDWATDVIKTVVVKGEVLKRGWYELSLALAITSGRRMDELHGQTIHADKGINRYYELQGDKIYISQLAKNAENTGFLFKPLVNAELWFKAYNLLPDTAKNLEDDKVNKVISSNIAKSPKIKEVFKILDLSSYKDSRDFYIVYRLTHEYKKGLCPQFDRESDYVQSIIGHNSKSSGHSYESFIVV